MTAKEFKKRQKEFIKDNQPLFDLLQSPGARIAKIDLSSIGRVMTKEEIENFTLKANHPQ